MNEPQLSRLGQVATDVVTRAARRNLAHQQEARTFRPAVAKSLTGMSTTRLDRLIATRRSVRSFSPRPVPRDLLADVCRTAVEADEALSFGAAPPRWVAVVQRVSGLDPALYTYTDGTFTRLADLPGADALRPSVQPWFVSVPAQLTPLMNLTQSLRTEGTDGYFNALVRTSYSLHSAWLSAVSAGVAGCLHRGLNPVLLQAVADLGRLDSRPFLALALGYAESESDASGEPHG